MTLATGRRESEAEEELKDRDTTGGHFMSQTALSDLLVSTFALLLLPSAMAELLGNGRNGFSESPSL